MIFYILPNTSLLVFLEHNPSFYPGALHLAEKRAQELEKKLGASEKSREEAERKVASVGDFRDRLHAAETALSEKEGRLPNGKPLLLRVSIHNPPDSRVLFLFFHSPSFCLFAYTTSIFILKKVTLSSAEKIGELYTKN
jgi:hypothetical protein